MSELPQGWEWARLDDVAEVRLGRQRSPKNHTGSQMRPYLRAANVGWQGLRLDDVKTMNFTDAEAQIYRLEYGDIVVAEASGSSGEVGRPALWRGEIEGCCIQNTLIRVRSLGAIDPAYLLHFLRSEAVRGVFAERSRGVGIHHIGSARLAEWTTPLPPLTEQRRIVDSLESQISRLDAAGDLVDGVRRKISRLELSTVLNALGAIKYSTERLAFLLKEPLVNGRSVPTRAGGFPVLRLSALASEDIQLAERKGGAWSRVEALPFLVKAGDYLISRGNGSLSRVGRGSAVPADPGDVAFPDTMIRIRPDESRLTLPYLALMWNLPMIRRQIEEKARTTAGIYKINQFIVEQIKVPLPSREDQVRVLQHVDALSPKIAAAHGSTLSAQARLSGLRSSLFSEAFAGRLVPQDPNDEPASVLLKRIRAQQAAQPKPKRGRRVAKNVDQGSLL